MILLDRMLIGGIKFVLGQVSAAVEAELNDDTVLREQLLAAQMQLELGEHTQEEFAQIEADVLERLRQIIARQSGGSGPIAFERPADEEGGGEFRLTADATFGGDDDDER